MNFSAVADYVRKMQRSAEQGELYGFADECRRLLVMLEAPQPPIKMMLFCPRCRMQHIDAPHGEWTNPPHATHLCEGCGLLWRPSNENTTGVALIHFEAKHKVAIFACIPPPSPKPDVVMTLPEALRYHATLMLAPEVAPRVRATLTDASRLMRDAAQALSVKPDPVADLCTHIKESIRLCGHGYIHTTCGDCQRKD